MERDTAETIVKIVAILQWVGAGLGFLGGILLMLGGLFLGALIDTTALAEGESYAALAAGLGLILGLVVIALSIVAVFVGVGLWRHQNWARITLLVFAWISGVLSALGVLGSIMTLSPLSGVQGLASVAVCGLEIWLFQYEPAIKALFVAPPTTEVQARK